MLEENLALTFETEVLGVHVTVESNLSTTDEIVAICRRGAHRQTISILELPLPTPPPAGAERHRLPTNSTSGAKNGAESHRIQSNRAEA
jgi:hypothetical protein